METLEKVYISPELDRRVSWRLGGTRSITATPQGSTDFAVPLKALLHTGNPLNDIS